MLHDRNSRLRVAFESSSIPTQILNADGSIAEANRAWYSLWGFLPENIPHVLATYSALQDPLFEKMGGRALLRKAFIGENRGTPPVHYEVLQPNENSEKRWLECSLRPIFETNGEVRNVIVTWIDITEKIRGEEQAKNSYEILAREKIALESSKTKSEFLANMSHEIRTPLNGIIGAAEMLTEEAQNETQKKYTGILAQSALSLMSIVNDILDFSKIEAGKLKIEHFDFSVHQTIANQIELLSGLAQNKNINLKAAVDQTLAGFVVGDANRIGQVLINLIGNAIKFTPHDGWVTISATPQPGAQGTGMTRFSVQDNGIGIDNVVIENLFQPFTQADNSTSRRFGGTGLGLSICKKLVELMGGEIGVESSENQGSEFWFTIPLPAAEKTKLDFGESINKASVIRPENLPHEPRKFHILIAEDNVTNQILAIASLKKLGYTAVCVANGREAVNAFQNEKFDLVLMDCHMPELDGLAATREIREIERARGGHVPVIALTASALKEDEGFCRGAGMDDFVAKPLRRQTLKSTLEKWLGHPREKHVA